MESYEDKLEVLNAHKRVVHESTKATRLVQSGAIRTIYNI